MRLVFSTDHFIICGQPYPGFPILLWDSMEGCKEVNEFFRYYLLRGAIGSKRSWQAIGQALYDFFAFLQAHELAWYEVDRGERKSLVSAYRDYCRNTAVLAPNTIRLRLFYVCEFYAFAQRRVWIQKLPFEYEVRHVNRGSTFLAHVDSSGKKAAVRDVMPRIKKDLPKFLSNGQLRDLLGVATNVHHRMLIRLALGTGLRREELATFPVAYVLDLNIAARTERNIRIRLDPYDGTGMKTKGSRPRDIYVSRDLMLDLYSYLIHHRNERAQGKLRAALFLNQSGEPFADNGKGLERIVRLLGKEAGLEVWPHLLRHTYATHTLIALQQQRDLNRIEPIVFLQHQLGHSSIQTTMVYLHLMNNLADEAVLTFDDELNDVNLQDEDVRPAFHS